jgi:hypothetical protein
MSKPTAVDLAKARFRPGTLVDIRPDALSVAVMSDAGWNIRKSVDVEYRAVRVLAYRGGEDDPTVCVAATNGGAGCIIGWFAPTDLIVLKEH